MNRLAVTFIMCLIMEIVVNNVLDVHLTTFQLFVIGGGYSAIGVTIAKMKN